MEVKELIRQLQNCINHDVQVLVCDVDDNEIFEIICVDNDGGDKVELNFSKEDGKTEEERLDAEYKSLLKSVRVSDDIGLIKSYVVSIENRWAMYRQNGYSFKEFMEDTESDLELQEPCTKLDVAIADRLAVLYRSSLLRGKTPTKWELYDLLAECKLTYKYPKFKYYCRGNKYYLQKVGRYEQ